MNSKSNRAAVQECPLEESDPDDHSRAEQRQKSLEVKHANIRELIGECSIKRTDNLQPLKLHSFHTHIFIYIKIP